jgi:branched-chain amino acid aminotransferase
VETSTGEPAANEYASGAAYVRGAFAPIAQAGISVLDWGFTRSDAVYDVVHVFRGGFFRLDDHLDRFARSMQARRLVLPEDRATIEAILHRCVALTGLADSYVAMIASRGRPRVFGSRRPADCENHLIAYAIPWIDVIPPDVQARRASVDRLDAARAGRFGRPDSEELSVERPHQRLDGGARPWL